MKDLKENLTLNFEKVEGNDLIIRHGEAEKISYPETLNKSGAITAPREFLSQKKESYEAVDSTLYVSKEQKKIVLALHEKNEYGDTIAGSLEASKELELLKINKDSLYSVTELLRLLKQVRHMFAKRDENIDIIKNLEKFNARVTKDIQQERNNNGSSVNHVAYSVSGIDWNNTFNLHIPIFKGGEKKTFKVEIAVDATDANVRFFLDSPDLYELQADVLDNVIQEEINYFHEWGCSVVTLS